MGRKRKVTLAVSMHALKKGKRKYIMRERYQTVICFYLVIEHSWENVGSLIAHVLLSRSGKHNTLLFPLWTF